MQVFLFFARLFVSGIGCGSAYLVQFLLRFDSDSGFENPLFDKYCYGNSTARLPLWIKPDRRLQNDSHSPPGGKCVISNRWFVAKKESDSVLAGPTVLRRLGVVSG